MMRRTASGKKRRKYQGQGHPQGRVAAGPGFVTGFDRCAASIKALILAWPGLQQDEITRLLLKRALRMTYGRNAQS